MKDGEQWVVRKVSGMRSVAAARTQEQAVAKARRLLRTEKLSQIVIHRPDGSIRNELTYGKDPERYPG